MKTLISVFLLLIPWQLCAQVFPVQVTTQLAPPFSPYLSDYTAPGAQHLMVHVRANDLTLSGYRCRLRITIEGVGITITTKPEFLAQPLILEGGEPQILTGNDLREYFHPYALDFSGFTRADYEKSARLPEGIYRFTVEVLDYNRGTVVSNAGAAMAWIILNDPPLLNLPANESKLVVQEPASILFSWTPRHSGSPNAAFSTEYIFRLVEVWPLNRNPYDAFLSQPPLYEVATEQNQVRYGASEPALLWGRTYAWQVEARDAEGRDLFKNQGRSDVFVFQYGDAIAVPGNLHLRWAKPNTLAIQWNAVRVPDQEDVKYRLQYRVRRRQPDHQWYETRTKFTDKTLYNLQADTEYEVKVRTETDLQESEYTETQLFRTLRMEEEAFVCRDDVEPPPLPADSPPAFPLSINDTIHAGGYDVLVRDVIAVEGKYFGSGFAIVPWFNDAKVRVTFENIRVNDRFWLTRGTIRSTWTPGSTFLLEQEVPATPGSAPDVGEIDVTIVAADSLLTVEGAAIATVTKDEAGNIVLITSDGKEQTLPKGETYAIVDDMGNGYVVDNHGNIAKTTSTEARAAAARGNREYPGNFLFSRGEGRYGFDDKKLDALASSYQRLDDGTFVPWKALSSLRPDPIDGHLQTEAVDIRDLRFEAGSLPLAPVSSQGRNVTLTIQGKAAGLEEELLALLQPADTLPPKVLGKINLVTYDPLHYNLVVVPVNGAAIPGGLGAEVISEQLNAVYRQAVVEWKVSIAPGIRVDLDETFDDGETGVLSNYTGDMKKVIKAFGRLERNTYYLFLIETPRNPSTLGYMPRNRQAGFVFAAPHAGNGDEFVKTIAHELGHGAFNLQHPFHEHNLSPGATDNIMDYSHGTALYKYQWDHIHDPQSVGLFEGDEEGSMADLSEEQILQWWNQLPPYKKAAEILREHLTDSEVYRNITSRCDSDACIITAELPISEEITYTMEITLPGEMSADDLIQMLISEYRVDLWSAFNVRAENMWDELYHWWRKQNDDLAQQKGWQVSTLNFLADVVTAPTLVPAVQGWLTGKHWRDGHELAGWEQALAALDFLIAEEMVKGCITGFLVRVGSKTVELTALKPGTKYLLQKSLEKGLKFSVVANDHINLVNTEGNVIASIVDNTLTIMYSKFGGNIVCLPTKTTTIIGRFVDIADGDGIQVIKNNKLYRYGENPGGVNILDDDNWSWPINESWLRDATNRSDLIRLVSDPAKKENLYIFKNGNQTSELTTFGKELKLLESLGYRQEGSFMVRN